MNLRLLLCFLMLGSPSFAVTMKEAEQLYRDGNYAEAFSAYEQLLDEGSGIPPSDAAQAVNRGRRCLERLDLVKLDSFLETAIANHGSSWQVLLVVAKSYHQSTHRAELIDGDYRRTWGRYDSSKRDRVRALQLLERAFPMIQQAADQVRADFWEEVAQILQPRESWRFQELTDLSELPDYEEQARYDSRRAPVNANGEPVFHQKPESWEGAVSDGERWRWVLAQLEEVGENHQLKALSIRARFLQSQFGVQTLVSVWRFSGEEDAEKAQLLARKLRDLQDDQTIAYLATGPQKITLPGEHNHLELWKQVAAADVKNGHVETALSELAEIHVQRDQRPKAAEYLRRAIQRFETKHHRELLQQLTGNFGRFDGTRTEAHGQPVEVGFVYRNASEVKFQARRIDFTQLLDDVKDYIRSNPKDWDWQESDIENIGRRLLEEDQQKYLGEEVAAWTVALEPREAHLERRAIVDTPLQEAGAYWLEAHVSEGNKTSVVVWVTDTAIVRKPLDGKFHHFIADARSGVGIAKADVEFFGWERDRGRVQQNKWKVNVSSQSKQTNEKGEVEFQQGQRDRKQWLTTARTEQGRFAYLGFRSMWARDYQNAQPDSARIFAITDRPAYRPGDTVNFKAWVGRSRYDQELMGEFEGRPVEITIQAPNGEKVYEAANLSADKYGGVSGQFVLGEEATLGAYHIRIESRKIYGSGNFRVEEYKKPEFEVIVEAPDEPIALGEKFTASVKAKYYFGAPVTNGEVAVKVKRRPHEEQFFPIRPWDWLYGRGYAFHLPEHRWYPGWNSWGCVAPRYSWIPWHQPEPELVLDETFSLGPDGTVKVEIDSSLAKELHGDTDHQYTIEVEVTDESRRTITGSGSVIAARSPFEVFVALNRGFYEAGDTIQMSAFARTPDGKPVRGKGAVTLYAVSYDQEGNARETKAHRQDVPVSEDGRVEIQLEAAKAGQFRLTCVVATDSGVTAEGARLVTVRGGDVDSADFRFNALELVPDQPTYQSGDTMKLLINTEQENSTVVLFLDPVNGVYTQPVILNVPGKSLVYEHVVEARDQPNFFVEAYTISHGDVHQVTQEIAVPPTERTLNLEVTADAQDYRPDTEAKLRVRLTNPDGTPFVGQTVLAVYDKAIEYISGGSNVPDIRSFFWSWKRRHHPQREDNLHGYYPNLPLSSEDLMPHFGLGLVGIEDAEVGGAVLAVEEAVPQGAMAKMARTPAPMASAAVGAVADAQEGGAEEVVVAAVRTDFADSIFWAAALETDQEGFANVSIDLPDNLTTWKIRGWGLGSGTRVGQGESEFTTSKKLVLRQQAPRFFVEKDEVVLSANVHNYLDKAVDVRVELELEGGVLEAMDAQSLSQSVKLDSGGEQRLNWRVKAVGEGEAIVRMKALTNIESDAVELSYPVYVHGILKTESWSGVIRPDETTGNLTFNVPAERKPEQSKLEVRFSPSIAAAMVDALPYLIEYPYGCTEQTVNRFIPCVITRKVLDDIGIDLKAIRDKAVNLNPQQLGDAQERAAQWKRHIENSPVFNENKLNRLIAKGSQKLEDMQNADGGWGWFTDSSSPHTTSIVVYGLQRGIAANSKINQGVYERGLQWLMRYEREQLRRLTLPKDEKGHKSSADHLDAYVASILAAEQRGESKMLDLLYWDRTNLTLYSKALLGLALEMKGRDEERDMVVRNLEQLLVIDDENQTAYLNLQNGSYWWHWYGNQIETHAAYLKLLVAIDPKSETASGVVKYLLNNRRHGSYWYNTRDTAACIDAIADYFVKSGEAKPDMTLQILVDGQVRKNVEIGKDDLFSYDSQFLVGADELTNGEHQLEFRKEGTGPLYFNAYLTNFTKEDPITKTGLEVKVERRFWKLTPKNAQATVSGQLGQVVEQNVDSYDKTRIDGESVLQSGDMVEVELIVESKNDYSYILIEDMKAAGMEPLDVRSGYFGQLGAYRELRDEKVVFFLRNLPQGQHSLSYRIKAEIPGKFSALPTKIMGMYAPELVGNADEAKIEIEDPKKGG
tara:strand:- start:3698 stop:9697 length:6000 start_codon:yes stop_codon:yes gene_type:complete